MRLSTVSKKLFIIDAMSLIYRAYYSTQFLSTKDGLPTSALFGTTMFLNSLLSKEKPDYIVIASDSKEPTFRHEMFKEYKANRSSMPEDLSLQMPILYEMFEAYGIKVLKTPGVEADDLIGSIAKRFASNELSVFIVSGDKDFMQLVNNNIKLYRPKNGFVEIVDANKVYEKFGVAPHQVIDCLAIIGDKSDNVPGVYGIGEKGAAKLISDYGTLDGVYANLASITSKKQREALQLYKSDAYLSKDLVKIKTDCSGILSLEEYACNIDRNNLKLLKLFTRLEFTSLI